jgi:hypothetical protein
MAMMPDVTVVAPRSDGEGKLGKRSREPRQGIDVGAKRL